MSEQMPDVSGILKELTEKGMIPGGELSLHPMKGTTSGHVYSVSVDNQPSYVLKLDHPRSNGPVANFLNAYRHTPLLPELVYADPSNAFLVYTYISGITHYQ